MLPLILCAYLGYQFVILVDFGDRRWGRYGTVQPSHGTDIQLRQIRLLARLMIYVFLTHNYLSQHNFPLFDSSHLATFVSNYCKASTHTLLHTLASSFNELLFNHLFSM
jgi:hypothetical protein